MTVQELIEELKKHDPQRLVVMSSDAEGNSISPLAGVGTAAYRAETTWSGEIGIEAHELAEMEAEGYTEDDVIRDGVPALTLWPTN